MAGEDLGVLGPVLKVDRNFDRSNGFSGEELAGVDRDDTEMAGWDGLPLVERDKDKEDKNVDDPEPCFNSVGKAGGIIFDSSANSGGPVSSSK